MATAIQFVNSIASVPTVRLDLNTGPWKVLRDTDAPPPELNRARVATLLTDGTRIPAAAYDNRVVTLRLRLEAVDNDAAATQLQLLHRELNRPTNILKWQPDATAPVFFRTFRSPTYRIESANWVTHKFVLVVPVEAEPFAYGLRVDLGPFTVNQDPAAGTNPTYADVTGVIGDVETPALLRHETAFSASERTVCAVRRHGTPANVVSFRQAEALTVGTDTTTQPNDPLYSGAGNNFVRTTFATNATHIQRLTGTFPNATIKQPADFRGTYRVFARIGTTAVAATTFTLQIAIDGGNTLFGDKVTATLTNTKMLVDLGLIAFPAAADPVFNGYSGQELTVERSTIFLHAGRTSGAGSLDTDYLLFIPADEEMCMVKWSPDVNFPVLDGPNDQMWSYTVDTGDDVVLNGVPSEWAGTIPKLTPNQTNRIYFLRNVGSTAHLIVAPTSMGVRFWPRYLTVRPAAT